MEGKRFKLDTTKQYNILEKVHETKNNLWLYCHTKHGAIRINKLLYENLREIYRAVRTKKDYCVIVVDGKPGAGKSTLVSQVAYILSDGKIDVPNVHFSKAQINKAFSNIKRGDVLWIDEAFNVANRRTSRGKGNMDILSNLQICRSKGPIIIITLPSFFDLDRQVTLFLTHMLLHVFRERPFSPRGNYKTYIDNDIKQLWIRGKDYLNYNIKEARGFYGTYNKLFTIDEETYQKKKDRALIELNTPEESEDSKGRRFASMFVGSWSKASQLTATDIARFSGVPQRTVYRYLKNYEKKYAGDIKNG